MPLRKVSSGKMKRIPKRRFEIYEGIMRKNRYMGKYKQALKYCTVIIINLLQIQTRDWLEFLKVGRERPKCDYS